MFIGSGIAPRHRWGTGRRRGCCHSVVRFLYLFIQLIYLLVVLVWVGMGRVGMNCYYKSVVLLVYNMEPALLLAVKYVCKGMGFWMLESERRDRMLSEKRRRS